MTRRNEEGFTLIELMIVVAIIGLLAAMAVPNYLTMQCRAKRTEAKMNFGGIGVAETTFFGNYNGYTTDLVALQWAPQQRPRYIYGFQIPGAAIATNDGLVVDPDRSHTADAAVIADTAYEIDAMIKFDGTPLDVGDLFATSTATRGSYLVGASGDLATDSAGTLDTLTMDNKRQFQVVRDDCPG